MDRHRLTMFTDYQFIKGGGGGDDSPVSWSMVACALMSPPCQNCQRYRYPRQSVELFFENWCNHAVKSRIHGGGESEPADAAWLPKGLFGRVFGSGYIRGLGRNVGFIIADWNQNFLWQWRLCLLLLFCFYFNTNTHVSGRRSLDDPWVSQWSITAGRPLMAGFLTRSQIIKHIRVCAQQIHSYRWTNESIHFTVRSRELRCKCKHN